MGEMSLDDWEEKGGMKTDQDQVVGMKQGVFHQSTESCHLQKVITSLQKIKFKKPEVELTKKIKKRYVKQNK